MSEQQQTPPAWHTGLDAETLGHIQNRGWDKLEAPAATTAAVKAFREAEKMIGAPPSEMVRLPKDASDTAGWNAVHQRLGRPLEAKGYDFSSIKHVDGKELDTAFVDAFRASAFEAGLSSAAANRTLAAVVKQMDSTATAKGVEREAALAVERDNLRKSWGSNYEANLFVAKRAAEALGYSPEVIEALENIKGVGYAKVMEMFRDIGAKIGEDKIVRVDGQNTPMTREAAMARKADLMKDKAWTDRYMAGGAPEMREMQALIKLIAG